MIAEFEISGESKKLASCNWKDVQRVIDNLHPIKCPYIIVENEEGNFMQCAGGKDSLVIEARFYNDDSFEHYVLGKGQEKKIWNTIDCKVGPIQVLQHEELNTDNAKELLKHFYEHGNIQEGYTKRKVTKQF